MLSFPLSSRALSSTLRHTAAVACAAALLCQGALAQNVEIKNAWVRATVQGQKATGAFMSLSSAEGSRLKSVSSPVAGVSEVHEMRVEDNVMKMKALPNGLELPAGKTVELKPGSYHVMLMDLKSALPKDSTVPLTLVFVDAKGVESKTELTLPVVAMSPMRAMQK